MAKRTRAPVARRGVTETVRRPPKAARIPRTTAQSHSNLPPPTDYAEPTAAGVEASLPDLSAMAERIAHAVQEEIGVVETMRAQLKGEPQSPQDSERIARTLSNLTETLQKLQRLQCTVPQTGSYDDDMPADIDEFRRALAQRIEAFVASRTESEDANESGTPARLDALR